MRDEAIIVPQPRMIIRQTVCCEIVTDVRERTRYRDCLIRDPDIHTKYLMLCRFVNCEIEGLDDGVMTPDPRCFRTHEDGRLIGFRTFNSPYANKNWEYEIGKTYTSELFSTSRLEVCHPGLHVSSISGFGWIKVLFDLKDLHSVDTGLGKAHRVRKFEVLGYV